MDMKKILQAFDGASSKPVVGASDMKKFLQIVDKSAEPKKETITEGANPHKVSLPVQMAMQHYQEPVKQPITQKKSTLLKQYFAEAEEEVAKEETERKERLRMYAQQVARRVMENKNKD